MTTPLARSLDDYLATLPAPQRRALVRLRKLIHAAAPECEERFRYGIPVFCERGVLVGISAAGGGACALYVFSSSAIEAAEESLAGFKPRGNIIRFAPERPIPARAIRRMVQARLAEVAAR
ncbi:MAG: DUF1801 domain-containing protein [Deltaproteobacteria bacterium]|nr:DUF1801 domain-containing protein [Deltaproteobacteria bacterium]